MSNKLGQSASLYLRQHRDNPVHWQTWNPASLKAARDADQPILLSIGYSACHWCHVMAHESFENEKIAAQMNELYVNIKLDREERPDLDKIYQLTHQLMNQRGGGWPLTVFLDPQTLAPFYSGTYFPPEPRHGLPGFPAVLQELARAFRAQRKDIAGQREQLQQVLSKLEASGQQLPPASLVDETVRELTPLFDGDNGGWSSAPKFPHPLVCELLLLHGGGSGRQQALTTLEAMGSRGLYDHLGGGFFRYSVDERWEIPHFEKMLYDNAQLLAAYASGLVGTSSPLFVRCIEETITWLDREMRCDNGLYAATLDADSEGIEGQYYAWTQEELEQLAGEHKALLQRAFRLEGKPNFDGRWHLQSSAQPLDSEQRDSLAALRERLFTAREQRVRPSRDDKQLTAWNALLAQGLARAGRYGQRPEWTERATEILHALHAQSPKGDLLALCEPRQAGFLDDYAFCLQAIVELLGNRWDGQLLSWAGELADRMLKRFANAAGGALHFAAPAKDLLYRPVPLMDEATPSGNGAACRALLQLGSLLGEPRYLAAAEQILQAAGPALRRQPSAHASLILALAEYHAGAPVVVLRHDDDTNLAGWQEAAAAPARLYPIPATATDLPAALAERAFPGQNTAYLCSRGQCQPPILSVPALKRAVRQLSPS